MNSHNLEVLIAGVKLTPRVNDASTFEGNRRVTSQTPLTEDTGSLPFLYLFSFWSTDQSQRRLGGA